jgi:Tol biopolymer transport system component
MVSRVRNIHPHLMPDGETIAFTVQMETDGKMEPHVYEMDIAETAWIVRLLAGLVYEDVSR